MGDRPGIRRQHRSSCLASEMDRLLAALKRKRHGQRDWLIGLLIYRHGLRVSEACDLRWDDVDLKSAPSPCAGSKAATTAATTWSGTNSPASRRSNAAMQRRASGRPTYS